MQIILQYCYSTILYIELYCSPNCKKIIIFYSPIYPVISLSFLSFFCALLTLPSLSPVALSSLKLHGQNFSPISEISHPSHTATLSSLIARLLSHCTGAGCWIFEVRGWISVGRRAGFGSLGWDRLMVGLDQLIGGFEMVDRWVDCLG